MAQLTPGSIRRLGRMQNQIRALQRGPDEIPPPLALQSPEVENVRVTSITATSTILPGITGYPGEILNYEFSDGSDTDLDFCFIVGRNNGALAVQKYGGRREFTLGAVPDIWTLTISGTWTTGDTITATISGHNAIATVGADTSIAAIAILVAAAWNTGGTNFADYTAAAGATTVTYTRTDGGTATISASRVTATSGAVSIAHTSTGYAAGVPVFRVDEGTAGTGFHLTVKEVDGSPSYADINEIRFDSADGFALSQPAAGIVRVDLTSGIMVEEQDGSPSYTSVNDLQFHQDDGFIVSQPAGSKALVRLTSVSVPAINFYTTNLYATYVYNTINIYNSLTVINYVTISSSQNNYVISIGVYVLIINATNSINITGIITGGANIGGYPITFINVGSNNITLINNSGSSSSGNKFYLPGGADYTIPSGGGTAYLVYDPNQNVWTTISNIYASISSLLSLTPAANTMPYYTGTTSASNLSISANTFPARSSAGNLAAKTITDFGLSLVDDADAATARATLNIGQTASVTATGSSQGDAALLTAEINEVSGADGTKGVILNTAFGRQCVYNNVALSTLKVYPPSGMAIGALGTNNPDSAAGGNHYEYAYTGGNRWFQRVV